MHRVRIDFSDGARVRGLRVGPIEFVAVRETAHNGRCLNFRVIWPGKFTAKLHAKHLWAH